MRPVTILSVILLFSFAVKAQEGTIKVRKKENDSIISPLNFAFFEKVVGNRKDSAIKWLNDIGFNQGELRTVAYRNYCGSYGPNGKRNGLHPFYFTNDSIDLVLTCRGKKVYEMFIITIVNNRFGKQLSGASAISGYELSGDSKKWRMITEKGTRLATLTMDKVLWTFGLKERALAR